MVVNQVSKVELAIVWTDRAQMDNCEQVDEIVMVGGSTRIPKVQKMVSEFFGGKELCKSVNPDEVVAQGAAIQAAIMSGSSSEKLEDVVLHDVTPVSLGIQVKFGLMSVVVPRNSPIPIKKEKNFQTKRDNQTLIRFPVYEGERPNTRDNNLLGEFALSNLPALPRGEVKPVVTFEIDENGILKVSAVHKETGNRGDITITNTGCLSEMEVEKMIDQARQFKEQDDAYRARSDARNDLLDYAYSLRNKVNNYSGSLKQPDKDRILREAFRLIDWAEANPDVSKETFELKKKRLDFICLPILSAC